MAETTCRASAALRSHDGGDVHPVVMVQEREIERSNGNFILHYLERNQGRLNISAGLPG